MDCGVCDVCDDYIAYVILSWDGCLPLQWWVGSCPFVVFHFLLGRAVPHN